MCQQPRGEAQGKIAQGDARQRVRRSTALTAAIDCGRARVLQPNGYPRTPRHIRTRRSTLVEAEARLVAVAGFTDGVDLPLP